MGILKRDIIVLPMFFLLCLIWSDLSIRGPGFVYTWYPSSHFLSFSPCFSSSCFLSLTFPLLPGPRGQTEGIQRTNPALAPPDTENPQRHCPSLQRVSLCSLFVAHPCISLSFNISCFLYRVGVDYITWYFRALDPLVRDLCHVTHTHMHTWDVQYIALPHCSCTAPALLLLVQYIHMFWV